MRTFRTLALAAVSLSILQGGLAPKAQAAGAGFVGDIGLKVFGMVGPGFGGELAVLMDNGITFDAEIDYLNNSASIASIWATGGVGYALRKSAALIRLKGRLGVANSTFTAGPGASLDVVLGGFTVGINASVMFGNTSTATTQLGAGIGVLF